MRSPRRKPTSVQGSSRISSSYAVTWAFLAICLPSLSVAKYVFSWHLDRVLIANMTYHDHEQALKKTQINIRQLLWAKENNRNIKKFPSHEALAKWTAKKEMYMSSNEIPSGCPLRALRRELISGGRKHQQKRIQN